jgi:hypothetical protein
LITGGTAYAFNLAGDVYGYGANAAGGYAAHAGVGCASSVASGGNCGQGAAAAVFGKYASVTIGGTPGQFNGYQMAATMVAGGVGSVIAGGKFENGAKTAAFGYLFNQLAHGFSKEQAGYEVRKASLSYGDDVDQWANGGGMDVRVPLSSLDLSSVRTSDFAGVGDQRVFNLSGNVSTRLSDQLVYGNVTLKLVAPGLVEAGLGYDRYNFDMKPLTVSTLPRNVATGVGSIVNSATSIIRNPGSGSGTPFFIQLDGRAGIR